MNDPPAPTPAVCSAVSMDAIRLLISELCGDGELRQEAAPPRHLPPLWDGDFNAVTLAVRFPSVLLSVLPPLLL